MEDHAALLRLAGHVKVELFDELTRKKVMETDGHNLFTDYGLSRFRIMSAMILGGQFGCNKICAENSGAENTYSKIDSSNFGFLSYLYLTDNAAPILSTANSIPGNVTGYADRSFQESTDPLRGILNISESELTETHLKAVFDFGTDKANGTHKSIFWSAKEISAQANVLYMFETASNNSLARNYVTICEGSDGFLYGVFNQTLYKIDPVTLEETASFAMARTINGMQDLFDVSGGKAYYTSYGSTTVGVIDLATGTETSFRVSGPGEISLNYGGCVIGDDLYFSVPFRSYICKYNITTNTWASKTPPTNESVMFRRIGNTLYAFVLTSIFKYDYDLNTVSERVDYISDDTTKRIGNVSTLSSFISLMILRSYYNGANVMQPVQLKTLNMSKSPGKLITGKLLDAPVTKNNTQTMKVTYTITLT